MVSKTKDTHRYSTVHPIGLLCTFLLAWLLLVVFAVVAQAAPGLQTTFTCSEITEISETECNALQALYDSTNGDGWQNTHPDGPLESGEEWFLSKSPCNWHGIECGDNPVRVTHIYLMYRNLTGNLPKDLADLDNVVVLFLYNNKLNGGIPAELGGMESLVSLHLSVNPTLGGSIPPSLGDAPNLKQFRCENCGLEGSIPAELAQRQLDVLALGANYQMSGNVPSFVWKIPLLDLSNTKLSGALPPKLEPETVQFMVHGSCFTGSIPDASDAFTNPPSYLTEPGFGLGLGSRLDVNSCPSSTGTLKTDGVIELLDNLIANGVHTEFSKMRVVSSTLESIPPQLYQFDKLKQLEVSASHIKGVLHAEVWGLQELTHLLLAENEITGLAEPATPLNGLIHLHLYRNQIEGDLPDWLAGFSALADLEFNENQFSGPIPDAWQALNKLTLLYLYNNNLSGTLPSWLGTHLPKLNNLHLENNQFTGAFPESLCNTQVAQIRLQGNPLTGEIPECIGNLANLWALTLGGTPQLPSSLSGQLPASVQELASLRSLSIVHSDMTGSLEHLAGLPDLIGLAFNSSNFAGTIPTFANAENIGLLKLYDNYLTGDIPSSLMGIGANNGSCPELDLRMNALTVSENDLALRQFLARCDPDWESWQTVPPGSIELGESYTTGFNVHWQPIPFSTGRGYYQVSAQPKEPGFEYGGDCVPAFPSITSTKGDAKITVTDLCPNTGYTFTVRAVTQANAPGGGAPFHDKISKESAVFSHETGDIELLSLYMLALDSNLDKHYEAALSGIQASTHTDPTKFAAVLVDRLGDDNTELLLIFGNRRVVVEGLPKLQGQGNVELDTTLTEIDMTDGKALGAFMRWAIDEFAPNSATPVTATYIGHGIALAPDVDNLSTLFDANGDDEPTGGCRDGDLCILPNRQDINPGYWTDSLHNSDPRIHKLISPQQLRLALEKGTNNGQRTIAVFDIAHCFGGTIEELYELTYNDHGLSKLMVDAIISSPNYTYFGDEILQRTLAVDLRGLSSGEMALAIVSGYEQALNNADGYDLDPDVDHPRLIVALQAGEIPNIKSAVDNLATSLKDVGGMAMFFEEAHTSSKKYDTTLCTECPTGAPDCADEERVQDWQLDEGDGLSDLRSFAAELANLPDVPTEVKEAATNVVDTVNAALIPADQRWSEARRSGRLWQAGENGGDWNFEAPEYSGIAIYTDTPNKLNEETELYVGWQAYWYRSADYVQQEPPLNNPNWYEFFATENDSYGWDELLLDFWDSKSNDGRIRAKACLLTLQPEAKSKDELFLPIILNR